MNAYRNLDVETFAERVALLGDSLGPIRAVAGSVRDEGLLSLVLGSLDPSLRIAFDFRHDSWDGVEADLPANAVRVGSLEGSASFRYIRFRDPPYGEADLRDIADRLRPVFDDGMEIYCYFRHEDEPDAPRCAARLLELLTCSPPQRSVDPGSCGERSYSDSLRPSFWERPRRRSPTAGPFKRDFWKIYARGTYQNRPRFAQHQYRAWRGRFEFRLTRGLFETTKIPDGTYTLRVTVEDTGGNRVNHAEPIRSATPIRPPVRRRRARRTSHGPASGSPQRGASRRRVVS